MQASSRLLFLAAWIFPSFCLIGGGLPAERIVAAVLAATLSGAIAASLPLRAFRLVRIVTALAFPLVWLWIGYACLDGMGPSPEDTIPTVANTNWGEAVTALRLAATPKSILFGVLSAGLLAASFWRPLPTPGRSAGVVVAASMLLVMGVAWAPRLLIGGAPAYFPNRNDWQNFPYGSIADLVAALIDHRPASLQHHSKPSEPRITESIDSIFVLGETFRFSPLSELTAMEPAAARLADRFGRGLGVFLPKVCASADATAISVPMLLTGTPPQFHDNANTAPSGLARLGSAGYETDWISNQETNFFADEKRDLLWVAKGYASQYDESLLPIAAAALKRGQVRNRALLLHLMDSHALYEERYPRMREPDAISAEQQDQLRYRRANAHTLRVVEQVAGLIDGLDTPAFAVYVSDHGENILADHNGIRYHGGARTTTEAAYVPAIVLWNQAFGAKYAPNERLRQLLAAPQLAHVDIYRVWMSFSGLQADLSPTPEPRILGRVHLGDATGAIPCASLAP
jgi:glucan phosphoethanolaminetransferase (alkaline phosphatase superfamily)